MTFKSPLAGMKRRYVDASTASTDVTPGASDAAEPAKSQESAKAPDARPLRVVPATDRTDHDDDSTADGQAPAQVEPPRLAVAAVGRVPNVYPAGSVTPDNTLGLYDANDPHDSTPRLDLPGPSEPVAYRLHGDDYAVWWPQARGQYDDSREGVDYSPMLARLANPPAGWLGFTQVPRALGGGFLELVTRDLATSLEDVKRLPPRDPELDWQSADQHAVIVTADGPLGFAVLAWNLWRGDDGRIYGYDAQASNRKPKAEKSVDWYARTYLGIDNMLATRALHGRLEATAENTSALRGSRIAWPPPVSPVPQDA